MRTINNINDLIKAVEKGFNLYEFTETLQGGKYILTHSEKIEVRAIAFCPDSVTLYSEDGKQQIRIAACYAAELLTETSTTIGMNGDKTVTHLIIK